MKVRFLLSQESKNGNRTIVDTEYSINKAEKLDLAKLSYTIAGVVFRKLDKQTKFKETHGKLLNFGIKVSQPFNLVVVVDDKKKFDLFEVFNRVTDGGKIKVNARLYKEDRHAAKVLFDETIAQVLYEAEETQKDFTDIFDDSI